MGGNPPGPFGGGLRPNPPRVETAGFTAGSFAKTPRMLGKSPHIGSMYPCMVYLPTWMFPKIVVPSNHPF